MSKSPTIIEPHGPPIHPGEILAEEIAARNMSITGLARALDVPTNRMTEIVQGRRGVTADTALRLSAHLGTSARFWLNLQASYDLAVARQTVGTMIAERVRPAAA
jgi:addiction module HigA family antidote